MRDKLLRTIKHPLVTGTAIVFLGTNLGNIFNFLYNLFMLRNLTAVDYGILVSMISIITLFAHAADSITPFVVNFAAIYFATGSLGKAKTLFFKITKLSVTIGFLMLLLFIVFTDPISEFLKIPNRTLVYIVGIAVFFGFVGIVNRAFLQAKLAFKFLAVIVFFSSLLKFSSGAVLVLAGFRVEGALIAFIIAFIFPYLLTFVPLRNLLHPSQIKDTIELKKMAKFGVGAVAAIFGLTAFITTDVLLVKHFFSPQLAGLYAGMTIAGKIIYFFSAPIAQVMFPLLVQKFAKKQPFHRDFRLALGLVLLPSVLLTILYFAMPEFVIRFVMKRDEYLAGVHLIGYIGIFFSIYALIYVLTNFFLSIQRTHIYIPIVFFASLQALLIWFFHDTLMQVVFVCILTSGLLLTTLLLYYARISLSRSR